ncbi:MAG: hypothetical protein AB8D78_09745 [Akkermansiaceae bacterium]
MPKLLAVLLLFTLQIVRSEPELSDTPKESAPIPAVSECIPEAISSLEKPNIFVFHKGLKTAVSAANKTAQIHTLQGLNHLHGGWEFEASRHFATAMEADPQCVMAHWGMVMSMLAPSPETDIHRLATTTRLLDLIAKGKGTRLERGIAFGLVSYIEKGPVGAEAAFKAVSKNFPKDMQSAIFAALFGRGGYNNAGDITPDQKQAEAKIEKLVEANPESAIPLHALLLIRAEAPDLRPSLEMARKLCQTVPDYAPYFHLLGHYEWRCGNHREAASAFGTAATLFSIWLKQNDVSPSDCPEWVEAESYRIVALSSKGDFDNALASAKKIAKTSVDLERYAAPGTRQLLWQARTLPARILLDRGSKGDAKTALGLLPKTDENEDFTKKSLSYWWVDGLRIVLEAHRLLDEGDLKKASETIGAVSYHGQAFVQKRPVATAIGEYSEWLRTFNALEILAAELRGKQALMGPKEGQGSAFNWFRAAADRQRPATMLSPPAVLTPMAARLGDFYLTNKKYEKAIETYEEALVAFPNDQRTSIKLQIAQEEAAKE